MNRRQLLASLTAAPLLHGQGAASHPRSHLRAGLVAYTYRKELEAKTLSYEDLIRKVSALGLDGLDTTVYWFTDNTDRYLAGLRNTAYKNGVSLYSAAVRVRLAQPTPELRQAEIQNAKKWIDVAEKLGAGHVRVFGGSVPKDASEAQCIGWAVEVLKPAADYAGSKGIMLGVEDDGGLTTTAEPTVEIVKRAAHPFAGINVDTGNFPKNGYQQVELCIPYATAVHLKTKIADPAGQKVEADWDRLASLFAKGNYKGYLSIEHEEPGDDLAVTLPKLATRLRAATAKYST